MKIVEYLGTGPNPIHTPHVTALAREDGSVPVALSKGDRAEASDDVAANLEAQGLYAIVGEKPSAPKQPPASEPSAPEQPPAD